MQTGNMDENYYLLTNGLDVLLARATVMYATVTAITLDETNREAVIVCFCHLSVACGAVPPC